MKINDGIGKHDHISQSQGDDIYNFGGPFLGYQYNTLSLLWTMPLSRKGIFKDIHQFYTFYPKITFTWWRGYKIYNFLSPYPISLLNDCFECIPSQRYHVD